MKKVKNDKGIKYLSISIICSVIIGFNILLYVFDKNVMPRAMDLGTAEMKAKAEYIINENIQKIFNDEVSYKDIVDIEKDKEGNILMIRADTAKMNILASKISLNSQKDLKEFGTIGIDIPLGYVLNNNLVARYGPKVDINMAPIGDIKTSYESQFESAGINQTRHRIYLIVETRIKVNTALQSKEADIVSEIPIVENIIVGKVPTTSINIDNK